jgi:hypothetical protein
MIGWVLLGRAAWPDALLLLGACRRAALGPPSAAQRSRPPALISGLFRAAPLKGAGGGVMDRQRTWTAILNSIIAGGPLLPLACLQEPSALLCAIAA